MKLNAVILFALFAVAVAPPPYDEHTKATEPYDEHHPGHFEHLGEKIDEKLERAKEGLEHAGHVVKEGAEHLGHEIVEGAEHVGHGIVKGVHEIGAAIHWAGHEIKEGFVNAFYRLKSDAEYTKFWLECDAAEFKRWVWLKELKARGELERLHEHWDEKRAAILAKFEEWSERHHQEYQQRYDSCQAKYPGDYSPERGY